MSSKADFLGLDNITVIDRSEKMPGGAVLEQSDATGWMGFFCLYLMRAALELANFNPAYEFWPPNFSSTSSTSAQP